ncbi:hypothetical protein R3W88_004258 [Solanum pinnatisectum]|uniref:Uncharacterized protein n=1 Tax=Solanum pinnatisectum TaxID=50273 RepID=A0AAV9KB61_9SOLN|nr:hypothetical protein R3W88_004258 [Solanum pinnatisectum]
MFIIKINGTVLSFEVKKFVAVTGLKCRLLSDFVSDLSKLDFLNKFKEAKFFEPEDPFKIGVLYFISTFLAGSEASKTTIPKLYFDLVKTGQYVNYPLCTECFRLTLKVWFYECCHSFDNTVAICVTNGIPRIFNWKTSNEIIFFKDLKNIIFRTYGNQMNVIDQNNLHESFSHHETENQVDKNMIKLKTYIDNSTKLIIDEIRSSRSQPTQTSHKEQSSVPTIPISSPLFQFQTQFSTTIPNDPTAVPNPDPLRVLLLPPSSIFQLDLILNVTTTPNVQPRNRNPGKYDTSPYIRSYFSRIKHPFESHNGFEVAADLIDEFNKWISKDVSSRRGRYICKPILFLQYYPNNAKSAYSKAKDKFEPQINFGVVNVSKMDFFNIMVKTGHGKTVDCWFMSWINNIEKQWRDSNYDMRSISPDHDVGQCIRGFKLLANISWDRVDDVIVPVNMPTVYDSMRGGALRNKNVNIAIDKPSTMIPLFLTSTEFYGKRLDLYANKLPEYVDKSQSDPLEVKHITNVPQQDEINSIYFLKLFLFQNFFSDCSMYTCLFVEYISNGVLNMCFIDIDNDDGAISESEVNGMVARKFDGPRIAKEHAPATSNYPTPRPRRSNLK